jgi:hypothetical protein
MERGLEEIKNEIKTMTGEKSEPTE